jgi:hypothetical protein
MRLAVAIIFAISLTRGVKANPVVSDPSGEIELISEKVNVSVHPGSSQVAGQFRFRQLGSVSYRRSIAMEVPFFALFPQALTSLEESAHAAVAIGERVFHPSSISVGPTVQGLPEGWRLFLLEFEIPRNAILPEFSARISYRQRHFLGDISAYYPIRPPMARASKAVVQFVAGDEEILTAVRAKRVVARSWKEIAVEPQDKGLILIRVEKRETN